MSTYESFLGPIHPGFYKPISPSLRKRLREIEKHDKMTRNRAVLTIAHPSLTPEEISARLGLKADSTMTKDEGIYKNARYDIKADRSYWTLSSERKTKKTHMEAQLECLIRQVFGILPRLRALQSEGAEFSIKLHCESADPVMHTTFSGETLQILAQLKCRLDIIVTTVEA